MRETAHSLSRWPCRQGAALFPGPWPPSSPPQLEVASVQTLLSSGCTANPADLSTAPHSQAQTRGTPRTAGHRGRRDTGDGAAVVKPNVHRMESMVLPYPDTRPRAAQGSVPEATAKPLVAPGHPENLADHRDKAGSQLPEPGGREGTQGPSTARKAGLGGLLRSTCSASPAETGRPSTCLVRVTSGASCSRGGQLQARKYCTLG